MVAHSAGTVLSSPPAVILASCSAGLSPVPDREHTYSPTGPCCVFCNLQAGRGRRFLAPRAWAWGSAPSERIHQGQSYRPKTSYLCRVWCNFYFSMDRLGFNHSAFLAVGPAPAAHLRVCQLHPPFPPPPAIGTNMPMHKNLTFKPSDPFRTECFSLIIP